MVGGNLRWTTRSAIVAASVSLTLQVQCRATEVPPEYLLGLMQSKPFADFYRLANQGDARVIPQIKAAKLLEMPIPAWDSTNNHHKGVVTTVRALLRLAESDSPGAARAFAARRRELEKLAALIYELEDVDVNAKLEDEYA